MRRAVINLSYTNTSLLVANDDGKLLTSLYKGYEMFDVERYSSDLNVLSEKGSAKLVEDIERHIRKAREMEALDIRVISTTLLRKAANADDVRKILEKGIGMEIRQLTGYEEACALLFVNERYSCLERPILINIGISATDICDFSRPDMAGIISLPFGSADIRENYISRNVPSRDEVKRIRSYVNSFLEDIDMDGFENAVLTGPIMNAVYTIYRDFFALEEGDEMLMQRTRLNVLHNNLLDRQGSDWLIDRNCPELRPYVIPALIILKAMTSHFKVNNITVSPLGIKEGWLKMIVRKMTDGNSEGGTET